MNNILKGKCKADICTWIEVKEDYEKETKQVHEVSHRGVLKLEKYRTEYIDEIADLFYDTVHVVCAKDYSIEQRNAWATGNLDKELWNKSLKEHYTIIAKVNGKIVGFGDIDGEYFDRLYVHKEYQGQGIAREIAEKLEEYAVLNGAEKITVHASITAKLFFKKRGYRVIKEQEVERGRVRLKNFKMEKLMKV